MSSIAELGVGIISKGAVLLHPRQSFLERREVRRAQENKLAEVSAAQDATIKLERDTLTAKMRAVRVSLGTIEDLEAETGKKYERVNLQGQWLFIEGTSWTGFGYDQAKPTTHDSIFEKAVKLGANALVRWTPTDERSGDYDRYYVYFAEPVREVVENPQSA